MNDAVQSNGRPKPSEWVLSGFVAQDPGDRSEQQDRAAILTSQKAPGCAFGVLADGMGGRTGGAVAAENVLLTSRQRFEEFTANESPAAFFESLTQEIHTALRLTRATSQMQPHSTVAAVLVQPNRVDWFHVGDSRIYHIRQRKLMYCTTDHTLAQELIQKRQLSPDRARLHPQASGLVNALGSSKTPVPEISGISDPQDGDTFLICSDGLWNYFHSGEMVLVIESLPIREAAQLLIARARERANGRGDNCSLVLLRLTDVKAGQFVTANNTTPIKSLNLPIVV